MDWQKGYHSEEEKRVRGWNMYCRLVCKPSSQFYERIVKIVLMTNWGLQNLFNDIDN